MSLLQLLQFQVQDVMQMASGVHLLMTHPQTNKKGSFLFEGASSTNQYFKQVCQKSLLSTDKSFSHEVPFLGARDIFVSNFSVKKRLR